MNKFDSELLTEVNAYFGDNIELKIHAHQYLEA